MPAEIATDLSPRPGVLIVGAGFGGLAATRGLRRAPVDVVVLDRTNRGSPAAKTSPRYCRSWWEQTQARLDFIVANLRTTWLGQAATAHQQAHNYGGAAVTGHRMWTED